MILIITHKRIKSNGLFISNMSPKACFVSFKQKTLYLKVNPYTNTYFDLHLFTHLIYLTQRKTCQAVGSDGGEEDDNWSDA